MRQEKKLSLGAEDSYTSGAMPSLPKINGNGNRAEGRAAPPTRGEENRAVLRVLGVDPAMAGATGYGVVEFCGARIRALSFGALRLPVRALMPERLRGIHSLIAGLLAEFRPDAIAVESVFTALNMRTALKLAEIRGVVLLAAAQAGVPAHSYSPREVKVSVTGYGAASKEQMQQMVRALLNLRECPEPPDAADAIAVAMCHAQSQKARELLAASVAKTNARANARTGTQNGAKTSARTGAKAGGRMGARAGAQNGTKTGARTRAQTGAQNSAQTRPMTGTKR
jgi:crossover junction endodeoxyribonuclease RuvC